MVTWHISLRYTTLDNVFLKQARLLQTRAMQRSLRWRQVKAPGANGLPRTMPRFGTHDDKESTPSANILLSMARQTEIARLTTDRRRYKEKTAMAGDG